MLFDVTSKITDNSACQTSEVKMLEVKEIVKTVYQIVAADNEVIRTYANKIEATAFVAGWNQAEDEAELYREPEPAHSVEQPVVDISYETSVPAFEQEYVMADTKADEVFEDTEPLPNGAIETL